MNSLCPLYNILEIPLITAECPEPRGERLLPRAIASTLLQRSSLGKSAWEVPWISWWWVGNWKSSCWIVKWMNIISLKQIFGPAKCWTFIFHLTGSSLPKWWPLTDSGAFSGHAYVSRWESHSNSFTLLDTFGWSDPQIVDDSGG